MTKNGYLSEESIKIYNNFQNKEFFRQAGKIHDMHIRNEENADVEIAKKRIDKYFKGELNLSWKTIIYEINKLPELERNKYFKELCEKEILKAEISAKISATNLTYRNWKKQNFFKKIKFLFY